MHCICHNPVWNYFGDTLFSDESVIKQISDLKRDVSVEPVSVMYTGGTIRPIIGGSMNKVDAIGFHGGQVVASGSKANVTAQMDTLGTSYATIELSDGLTLLPGLIEPHVHIVLTAIMKGWHDFGPFDGQYFRELYDLEWLKEEIESAKGPLIKHAGGWILGCNVDPSLMPFIVTHHEDELNILQRFDCDTLDKIENEVPLLMMSASGHTAYVNTQALQKTYDSSEEVRAEYPTFDDYRAHVNSGGGLQEINEMMPAFFAAKWQILFLMNGILKYFDSLFETANQRGVTLMYDAAMSLLLKAVLEVYLTIKKPRVRIGYAQLCETLADAEKLDPYVPPTEFKNVYHGSVKLVSDGSNQGLTGYQNEPYCCEPADNEGLFNFTTSDYMCMVKTIAEKGWPMMIHANGNKAIDLAIAAYRDALGGESGQTKRHRIEHCSLLNEENLDNMRNLGISPSFLIGHVGYWGYVFKNAIFEEKAEQLVLCKSALDRGMRITIHSDNFVTPLGPLRMMEQAITRIDSKGNVLNEKEKITVEQALRAVTYDAAWQCHADQWVGSLEAGKMADYVILEEDPITREDPVGMRDIPVLETWVGGINVYKREVTPV